MDRKFDQTAVKPVQPLKATELPPGMHIERRTPVHPPTVGGQVVVPFLRSVISGWWFMLAGIVITNAAEWPWWVPLVFFILGGSCVWCAKGLSDQALFLIESATGRDINQDGDIGRPVVHVEVSDLDQRQWRFMDLPGTPEALQELARGVLAGKTLAEAEWTGTGRPYTRNEFRDLRAQLVDRGIAAWRNPQHPAQGVELTKPGRAVFAEIARTHAHARTVRQIEHREEE
jgi:hypothetical protein